ncbi:MAG: hypothetical protein H0T45_02720 [Pyrinomonadaceae bacterium]|nr:hypothetical protein [Pyrinomonadaceae bacterium]
MSCHKSTISREVRRNQEQRGDRPRQAHQLSTARHRAAYHSLITKQT